MRATVAVPCGVARVLAGADGGEPFQPPEAFLDVLEHLRGSGLCTLALSGYTLRAIEQQPQGPAILRRLDVLVAGRYLRHNHAGQDLLGSANQRIYLLTKRYPPVEIGARGTCEPLPPGVGGVKGIARLGE
jgi:hypothetical protein